MDTNHERLHKSSLKKRNFPNQVYIPGSHREHPSYVKFDDPSEESGLIMLLRSLRLETWYTRSES